MVRRNSFLGKMPNIPSTWQGLSRQATIHTICHPRRPHFITCVDLRANQKRYMILLFIIFYRSVRLRHCMKKVAGQSWNGPEQKNIR